MGLPDQVELLKLFSAFLTEARLSAVSIKNYLSDLRHFLSFVILSVVEGSHSTPTVKDIFQNLHSYLDLYLQAQKASFTPANTTNRRLASIRRFSTFLSVKFSISNLFTDQNTSGSSYFRHREVASGDRGDPSLSGLPRHFVPRNDAESLSSEKILEQFKTYLEKDQKTPSTVKNYLSDLHHFFLWTANQTPFTDQNLVNILSEQLLSTYVTYLKLSHTSTSVINRRQSSIKKLTKFSFEQGYLPENPFELKNIPQTLSPLAWLERFTHRKTPPSGGARNRIGRAYDRYHALPWTPYLNLALLVLATTAMAIFAYNQIISQARPSSAATTLTPPKRQLSFQGRLTDSGGTPITTAVNVVFKLFNALSGPTQLYTTGTCSITPDQDGIFNTLIGNTVCGAEITSTVFTDNRDVYLEITVGAETLTPRQQIATVGYALNSETLQGYPASAAATINTVPVVDNSGNINIAATSPSIISSAGTFSVQGQVLSLKTGTNSGGDVIFQPDALGSGQILALGGTTTEDSYRITNANLTSGSLLSGYVGNDTATGRLLSLTSGSTETERFWVAADGRAYLNTTATNSAFIVNQSGTGNLFSASASGVAKFTLNNA
ncbi:MAG: site-specific integrase, partial [Candidatus Gracilibacteria bacterium]